MATNIAPKTGATVFSLTGLSDFPDLAQALGEMVITWANAEISLIGAMTRVSGSTNLRQMQHAYYHLNTFDARIKYVRALIPDWRGEGFDKEAIDNCVEKISKLAGARNHWIHGDWCMDTSLNQPVIFDHRTSKDHLRKKPVKAADVMNHVEAVRARSNELKTLTKMHEFF